MFAAVPELGRSSAPLPCNVEDRMTEHVYKALDAKPKLPCWDGTSGWRDYEQKMWRVARAIGIEREVRLAANGGVMDLDSDEHLAQSRIWFDVVRDSVEPACGQSHRGHRGGVQWLGGLAAACRTLSAETWFSCDGRA